MAVFTGDKEVYRKGRYPWSVWSSGSQVAFGTMKSWWDQDPGILRSSAPGHVRTLGVMGLAAEFASKDCSGPCPRQNGCNPYHWSGGVPACLCLSGTLYSRCWGMMLCLPLVWSSDPMNVRWLAVELPPGVIRLATEFACKVYSRFWLQK